jgi:hypothetical protein
MFPEPTRLEHHHHHRLPDAPSTDDKASEDYERPF